MRVLVVDDNVDAADSLAMLLRLHGHEVQVARTGPTALEMASASRPDVVLLDVGLPGMDGYHVAKRLRERPEFKDVVMCALTGFTPSEADRQRQQDDEPVEGLQLHAWGSLSRSQVRRFSCSRSRNGDMY